MRLRWVTFGLGVMSSLVVMPAWAELFGGTAVRTRNVASIPKWMDVLGRTRVEALLGRCQENNCPSKATRWYGQLADWQGMGRYEQMVRVNRFVNGYPYITDDDLLGVRDYWQTPGDFLRQSGDCEDYAITKYYTLKALGWPESALRLVIVRDAVRGIAHAVLAVKHGGVDYILDNLATEPLADKYVRQYSPYYAINAEYRWVYLRAE
jgi:predicted transglutaminase-like cysteine proteinase